MFFSYPEGRRHDGPESRNWPSRAAQVPVLSRSQRRAQRRLPCALRVRLCLTCTGEVQDRMHLSKPLFAAVGKRPTPTPTIC
jgi:hypothetical protein